jgi:glycosyltransferase involved in cell wall biosynthesis
VEDREAADARVEHGHWRAGIGHDCDAAKPVRALIVTNMYPSPERPALGRFVYDQVEALRRLGEVEVEVFSFDPGSIRAYLGAGRELGRRRSSRFDVVHAHYGLTAWPALAAPARARAVTLHGTDLSHPRSRLLTAAALPAYDLVATASSDLADRLPPRVVRGRPEVLPCGVDLGRFSRLDRREARKQLGLDPDQPCLLFPADPARAEKRFDRARAVAGDTALHALGDVEPGEVGLWINACNAVLVPSEREGFGLAVLEALACDVPVLATPVGIHAEALAGVAGTLCSEFDVERWRAALAPHLADADADPRVAGRAVAERYSSDAMAVRVLEAWRSLG